MIKRLVLAAVVVSLGCGVASAQGLDGLFLEMTMRTGRIETNHYFYLPDGRYLNGVPEGALTAAGMELACAQPEQSHNGSSRCGTYRVTGGTIVLTPRQGPPESLAFERLPDGNYNLEGHFNKHVPAFPAGQTLDGKYARVNSGGAMSVGGGASASGGPSVAYGESYTFRPDGTFSTGSLLGVDPGGYSQRAATGTYRLSGNVLELIVNAKTTRLIAYPYDLGKGDVRLNLNGEFFRK
jgi:hypothetical protein